MFFIDIYVKTDGAWNKVNVQDGSRIRYMAPVIIEFLIDNGTYEMKAENGMTWGEWVNSSYNTDLGYMEEITMKEPENPESTIIFTNAYNYSAYLTYEDYGGDWDEDMDDSNYVKASHKITDGFSYYFAYFYENID